jgi:hypothetical protein
LAQLEGLCGKLYRCYGRPYNVPDKAIAFRSRDLPAPLLVLSILIFPLGPRLAGVVFVGAAIAAAVSGRPSRKSRAVRLAVHGLFLAVATAWLVARVVPPWGSGVHTLTLEGSGLYPVTFLDYAPFLWALYLLSWHRFDSRDLRLVCSAIAATMPLHAILVFGQMYLEWHGYWSWRPLGLPLFELSIGQTHLESANFGRATGRYAGPNLLALSALCGVVASMTLLWVERARRARRTRRRVATQALFVFALLTSTWVLLRSGSRITWFVVAVLFLGAAARLTPRPVLTVSAIAIAAGALVFLSVRDLGPPTRAAREIVPEIVWERIAGTDKVRPSPLSARVDIWECGLRLVREQPLTGIGLGRLGPECEARVQAGSPYWRVPAGFINHAHNVFIQTAADLGLPFTVLLTMWILWIVKGTIPGLARAPTGDDRTLRVGILLIVGGVLAVSQLNLAVAHDFGLEAVFCAGLAILASPLGEPSQPIEPVGKVDNATDIGAGVRV